MSAEKDNKKEPSRVSEKALCLPGGRINLSAETNWRPPPKSAQKKSENKRGIWPRYFYIRKKVQYPGDQL